METQINREIVNLVVGQAATAPAARIEMVAVRFEAQAARGETISDSAGRIVTPATAAEIASQLRQQVAVAQPAAPVAPTSAPAGKVRVRIVDFGRGIRYAKQCGGMYEPASKTWLIPASRNELNGPANYGWKIVGR